VHGSNPAKRAAEEKTLNPRGKRDRTAAQDSLTEQEGQQTGGEY